MVQGPSVLPNSEIRNSKSEARNKFKAPNSNDDGFCLGFCHSVFQSFVLVSDFVLRALKLVMLLLASSAAAAGARRNGRPPGPRTSSGWESPEESETRSVSEGETGGYVDFLANASGSYIR
jgi:hypothetical protein